MVYSIHYEGNLAVRHRIMNLIPAGKIVIAARLCYEIARVIIHCRAGHIDPAMQVPVEPGLDRIVNISNQSAVMFRKHSKTYLSINGTSGFSQMIRTSSIHEESCVSITELSYSSGSDQYGFDALAPHMAQKVS